MNWKETYTKVFLKQKGKAISEVTLKQYMSEWWQNTRAKEQGGLRLTDAGFEFVRNELDLATYDVPFPKDFEMTTNTIIWLDQFITCPYYLFRNSIVVLDERKAMELHLFSGDIKKYGLTKAMNRHKN
tara:strand:+ start:2023 stop:2406 length:384 start_codon:yes stop_codon:yes gene_type:complete